MAVYINDDDWWRWFKMRYWEARWRLEDYGKDVEEELANAPSVPLTEGEINSIVRRVCEESRKGKGNIPAKRGEE
jgi:hypothetical protein